MGGMNFGNAGEIRIPVTIPLSGLDTGLRQVKSKLDSGIRAIGSGLERSGRALSKAITAPIVAAFGTVAVAGARFEDTMARSTSIIIDLTDEMRKEMGDTAKEIAKTTRTGASQAAEGYYFLASAGLDAAASIKALPAVARFATAGTFDLARATDLLTDAQSALGMTIREDANKNLEQMILLSDTLAKASVLSNASIEQFSEALTNKAAPASRAANRRFTETIAALAVLADQGKKGRIAGEQLSIVWSQLPRVATDNAKEFKKLGIEIFDTDGRMRELADIVDDFTAKLGGMSDEQRAQALTSVGMTEALGDVMKALMGNAGTLRRYESELQSASGFTEKVAARTMDSFAAKLTVAKNRIEVMAISIYERLQPAIESQLLPSVEKLIGKLEQLTDAYVALDDKQALQVAAGLGIAAAIGPGLIALSVLIKSFGVVASTVLKAGTIITGVVSGFTGAIVSGSFLAAAGWGALIAAVVGGVVLLVTKWDTLKEKAKQTFDALIAGEFDWQTATQEARDIATGAMDAVATAFENMRDRTKPSVQDTSEFTLSQFDKIRIWAETNGPLLARAWDNVAFALEKLRPLVTTITQFFASQLNDLLTIVDAFVNQFHLNIDFLVDILLGTITVGALAITGQWSEMWQTMKDYNWEAKMFIVDTVENMWSAISDIGARWKDRMLAPYKWVWGEIKEGFQKLGDVLVWNSIVPDMVDALGYEFDRMSGLIVAPTRAALDAVMAKFDEASGASKEAAANMRDTFDAMEALIGHKTQADTGFAFLVDVGELDRLTQALPNVLDNQEVRARVAQFWEQYRLDGFEALNSLESRMGHLSESMRRMIEDVGVAQAFQEAQVALENVRPEFGFLREIETLSYQVETFPDLFRFEDIQARMQQFFEQFGITGGETLDYVSERVRMFNADVVAAFDYSADIERMEAQQAALQELIDASENAQRATEKERDKRAEELAKQWAPTLNVLDGMSRLLSAMPAKFRKLTQVTQTASRVIAIAISTMTTAMKAFNVAIELAMLAFSFLGEKGEKEAKGIDKVFDELGDALEEWGQRLTDEIVGFIRTGEFALDQFVQSVLEDFLRISIQATIVDPVIDFIGGAFAKGAAFDNGRVTPFAGGGVVSSPTMFKMQRGFGVMGEAGAEAILPLSRTSNGDLGVNAEGIGGGTIVNVIDRRGAGAPPIEVQRSQRNGYEELQVIVHSEVGNAIARGMLDRTMYNRYGLRPRGI